MNQKLEEFIDLLEEQLPALCCDGDLLRTGIFGSRPTASRMRSEGTAPNHFRLGNHQIRYLKGDVIDWIRNRYVGGENGARR